MKRAAIVALLTAFAADASAQETPRGFAIDRFDPSERGSGWFASDSLDLRGQARPAVGIVASWAHDSLLAYNADGSQRAAVIQDQLVLHPGASIVLADRLRLAMDIPIAVLDSGTSTVAGGVAYVAPSGAAIGDVRVSADVRLAGSPDGPFTVAVGVPLYLPSGSQSAYMGDGTVRAEPRVLAAGELGWLAYAGAAVGVLIRPLQEDIGGIARRQRADVRGGSRLPPRHPARGA